MMIKITKRLPFLPLVFKQNFQTGYTCNIAMSKHVIKKSKKSTYWCHRYNNAHIATMFSCRILGPKYLTLKRCKVKIVSI